MSPVPTPAEHEATRRAIHGEPEPEAPAENRRVDAPFHLPTPPPPTLAEEIAAMDEDQLAGRLDRQTDPWAFLEICRAIGPPQLRLRFVEQFYLRLARPSVSQSERDALISAGQGVFRYRTDTARDAVKALIRSGTEAMKVACSVITEAIIAEVVNTGEPPNPIRYLLHRVGSEEFETVDHVDVGSVRYTPPQSKMLTDRMIPLPTGIEEYGQPMELVNRMRTFIDTYLQVTPEVRDTMVLVILQSWIADQFPSLGYLRFQGDFSSGKSRALDLCKALCYRPVTLNAALTPPVLFRLVEKYRGTLITDEAKLKSGSETTDIILAIYNSGYHQGGYVVRMEKNPATGVYEETPFMVFGPKVLASRTAFDDAALESRCLSFTMPVLEGGEILEDIPYQLPPEFEREAQSLRNQLLRWRFRNVSLQVSHLLKVKGLAPRLNEVILPLLAIVEAVTGEPDSPWEKNLIELFKGFTQRSQEERSESWEGIVAAAIVERWKASKRPDRVQVKEVAELIEKSHPEYKPVRSRSVTGTCKRVFGVNTERMGGSNYWFILDAVGVAKLCRIYTLQVPRMAA